MNNSPLEIFQGHIANFRKFLGEYDALDAKKTDSENRLAELSANGDLEDEIVLTKICQLQVFIQLFPGRIQARANRFGPTMMDFKNASGIFIGHMKIRADSLLENAKVKVAALLKSHFQDEDSLVAAVKKSGLVSEAVQLADTANHAVRSSIGTMNMNSEELLQRGERLLAAWGEIDAFEAKLETQP